MASTPDDSDKLPDAFPVGEFTLKADEIPWATNGLNAPTIFCDIIRGSAVMGGVTKISLVENRVDVMEEAVRAIHVATIIVPTPQLRGWGSYFTKLADQLGLPPADADGE